LEKHGKKSIKVLLGTEVDVRSWFSNSDVAVIVTFFVTDLIAQDISSDRTANGFWYRLVFTFAKW
jgi:hypothetical protein